MSSPTRSSSASSSSSRLSRWWKSQPLPQSSSRRASRFSSSSPSTKTFKFANRTSRLDACIARRTPKTAAPCLVGPPRAAQHAASRLAVRAAASRRPTRPMIVGLVTGHPSANQRALPPIHVAPGHDEVDVGRCGDIDRGVARHRHDVCPATRFEDPQVISLQQLCRNSGCGLEGSDVRQPRMGQGSKLVDHIVEGMNPQSVPNVILTSLAATRRWVAITSS